MVEYDVVNIPIVDIVNQIILFASKNRASDIHMDPRDDYLLIRMRIDGELRDHAKIPKAYERNLITRVKLISNMNITETRLPQDGAIKGRIEGKDLDMRVSVLPTNEGEKVVIRVLDYSKSLNGIESLGFSPKNFELLQKMLSVPNGIILVTGATGSGKSTTTYSMLQALNKEETNIITVEDPIEMNIEGINQVQVNSEIGLTFAAVLRSILRQDPNVILIGEIRDSETAQIAVRASITGHLVLSTLHTNNSLSTIERLLDMDVERYLLSSALTGIISQKLARKLCNKCKVPRQPTDYEKEIFKLVLNKEVETVYDAKGCPECTQGYHGRIAIEEVLYISDELKATLANPKTTKDELKKMVYTDDVTTLLGDGLEKIINGDTSFDELFKLIEVDLEIQTIREESIERTERRERNQSNKGNLLGNLIIEAPEAPASDAPIEGADANETEEAQDNVIKLPSTTNIIIQAPVNTPTGPSLDIPTGDSISTPVEEKPKDSTELNIPSSEENIAPEATAESIQPSEPQVEITPTVLEENTVTEPVVTPEQTIEPKIEITPAVPEENIVPETTTESIQPSEPQVEITPTVPEEKNVTEPVVTPEQTIEPKIEITPAVPEENIVPETTTESAQPSELFTTTESNEIDDEIITDTPVVNNQNTEPQSESITPTAIPEGNTSNLFGSIEKNTVDEEIINNTQTDTNSSNNGLFSDAVTEEVQPIENTNETSSQGLFGNGIHTFEPEEEKEKEEESNNNDDINDEQLSIPAQQNEEIIDTNNNQASIEQQIEVPSETNNEETPAETEQLTTKANTSDESYDYKQEISRNSKKLDYLYKYLENEVINGTDDDNDSVDEPILNNFVPDQIKKDPLESYFRNNN